MALDCTYALSKSTFLIENTLRIARHYVMLPKYEWELSKRGRVGNSILLEASSMCQLNCPLCPTGQGLNRKNVIGWGYLKFQDFKKLVDANPDIRNIELSNYGEIFLNPELGDIIKYAFSRGINLSAGSGVNLNNVREDMLECLVQYRLSFMNVAIDGAADESYGVYRKGGDFEKVIANVKTINHFKRRYNSKFPELRWQFVIMGHNERELPIARKMARELDMVFVPKLNWDPSFSPVKDKEFVRRESGLGVASIDEYRQRYGEEYMACYKTLWKSPQINWDGRLLGCCVNMWSDFGNVFEDGLTECLKGERYMRAKRMLLGETEARDDLPCIRCPVYARMSKSAVKRKYAF